MLRTIPDRVRVGGHRQQMPPITPDPPRRHPHYL